MRRGALTHPKMRRLARLLRVRVAEAYGLVCGLLDWAYVHATDGAVGRWDDDEIAHGSQCECADGPTFVRALLRAGWLDHDSRHRLVIHDLADHADDTWRKTVGRHGKTFVLPDGQVKIAPETPVDPECPDNVQTLTGQSPDNVWDIKPDKAMPDKAMPYITRGGSGGNNALAANGASRRRSRSALAARGFTDGFDRFWDAYPRKKGKAAALKAWSVLFPNHELIETILAAVTAQRDWPEWRRDAGQFVPHPATWLHQQRWHDERDPAPQAFTGRTAGNLGAVEQFLRERKAARGEPT